jgi:hypothetical protein
VLDGITLYVAELGEPLKTTAGEVDRRLRLIFSNGTESNLLLRSLQRAFYDDPAARRLASPGSGQLSFGGELEADDVESGTIYVLRSLSDHPYVAQHRDIIHKLGVTGGRVETRIRADPRGLRRIRQNQCRHLRYLELREGWWVDDGGHLTLTNELGNLFPHPGQRIAFQSAHDQDGPGSLGLGDDAFQ